MILGLDPSLRNFGWVLIDDDGSFMDKGMMSTSAKEVFIERYIYLREGLREIIQKVRADHPDNTLKVGIESPIFNDLYSEGMYGLFLYSNEALMLEKVDTVYLTPNQVKAHAHAFLGRPKGWKMLKADMVDAAKQATQGQTGANRWNHHQADAFWVGRTAARFWALVDGDIESSDLTDLERKHFSDLDRYVKGKKAGKVKRMGITHKENDRFFRWSDEGNN
jgi:Holliday junction resolvasome RuvABC endonuclease subunit